MLKQRGRPARPLPIHPERVVSIAMQTGLSATVRLQRAIKNKITEIHFESSDRIWKTARQVYITSKRQGKPDYSYILKAEPQIRDNQLKMLYEKAAEYGFLEVQRQKNTDGTVGPHNQRINACGANLRDFSEIEFPLPTPTLFGTRTQRVGAKRREFRLAGYEGTSFGPKVILSHPDLPSMDFGDAVRSHNECLATFSTICNVPLRETSRYSNLFLLLVRPYLEQIYSEYKYGEPGFREGVNKALRKVKDLITEAGYRPTIKTERSVTSMLEYDQGEVSADFFNAQYDEAHQVYGNTPAVLELKRVRNGGFHRTPGVVEPCLTIKDVEHIREKAIRRGMIRGSIMHRRIENLFPTPWNLKDVIFRGHEYSGSSDYVIVSELPLETDSGTGKVDLTLLERVITKNGKSAVYRPALTCEIKTRMAHKWHLDAIQKISKSRERMGVPQRVVAEFPMSDRPMYDSEWESVVESTPHKSARKQVGIYADALAQRFVELTGEELAHVYRATIMIEARSDINQVRRVIEGLVMQAFKYLLRTKGEIRRTIITPTNAYDCKIALVIHEQRVKKKPGYKSISSPWIPPYNPFHQTPKPGRRFILYLTGGSSTSAGTSAAYNARNYHALQMLYQMKMEKPETKFLWVDLADQYVERQLAETRLQLRPRRYTPEEVMKAHHKHILEFFEQIEVKGYLEEVLSHLFENEPEPIFKIRKESTKPIVIIVSGIDVLKNATPESQQNRLQIVLDKLLTSLPDDAHSTILWFDQPVPSVEKAIPFGTRALLPYYSSSSLSECTTEIIWNLPTPPKSAVEPEKWNLSSIGDTPMYDEFRIIITNTPERMDIQFESIPLLQGWSNRFKNRGRGLIHAVRSLDDVLPRKELRDRIKLLSLTLIPWIMRLSPACDSLGVPEKTLGEEFNALIQEFRGKPNDVAVSIKESSKSLRKGPSTLELLRFRQPNLRSGKAYVAMTLGRINSQRLYRASWKLKTKPKQRIGTSEAVKDIDSFEDEVESEWMFGVEFQSDDSEYPWWWLVLQDPTKSSKLLVGCFPNRLYEEKEIHWSETRQDILTHKTLDTILGSRQVIIAYRPTEQGFEAWHLDPENDDREFSGLLEVISKGYGSVGHLQGFRLMKTHPGSPEPPPSFKLSESFYQRTVEGLKGYLNRVTSPISVIVQLERIDDACKVTFTDKEGVILQEVKHESVPDLLALLRLPVTRGGPMNTDAGKYITWNIFEDIDYTDMEFIRPYVVFSAARMAPEEIPSRISQFFGAAEEIIVEIRHDELVCPLALGEGEEHEKCWYIQPTSEASRKLKKQMGKYMKGRDLHGLLSPRRIWSGRLYEINITFNHAPGSSECLVFQEEKWIRKLLRSFGVNLPQIPPGSFLRADEEKWIVEISTIEYDGVTWNAISTLTGKRFSYYSNKFPLDFTNNLEEELARILHSIMESIGVTPEKLHRYTEIEESLATELRSWGFGDSSPPCRLLVNHIDSEIHFVVKLRDLKGNREVARATIKADKIASKTREEEQFIEELENGWLSHFVIVNEEESRKRFSEALDQMGAINEDNDQDYESEIDLLTLHLYVEDTCIKWKAIDEQAQEVDEGVLLEDAVLWFQTVSLKEFRDLLRMNLNSIDKEIRNLNELVESDFVDIIDEVRESLISKRS